MKHITDLSIAELREVAKGFKIASSIIKSSSLKDLRNRVLDKAIDRQIREFKKKKK